MCCRSLETEPIFLRIIVCDLPGIPAKKYSSVIVEGGAQAGESTVKMVGQSETIGNMLFK